MKDSRRFCRLSPSWEPSLLLLLIMTATAGEAGRGMQETVIAVKGMVCSSCSNAVEQAVKRLDGIGEVRVDLKKDLVRVTYDPTKVTPRQMVETIRKAGYEARLPAEGDAR